MKCEIINGWLVVEPSSETERWAFEKWLESRPSWESVASHVRVAEPVRETVDAGPHTHTLGPTPPLPSGYIPFCDPAPAVAAVTVGTTEIFP